MAAFIGRFLHRTEGFIIYKDTYLYKTFIGEAFKLNFKMPTSYVETNYVE